MHLIFCVDERYGFSFNGRRLSRDRALCSHILTLTNGSKLWMNHYSAALFPTDAICVDDDYIYKAESGSYCFMENTQLPESMDRIESIILYCWNRTYPYTVKFPAEILEGFDLIQTEDFAGNSHERITMRRFIK